MKKTLIFLFLLLGAFLIPTGVHAVYCEDKPQSGLPPDQLITFWDNVSKACDEKISTSESQIATYQQAISTLNSKINLARAEINRTQIQINSLEKEITVLGGVLETVNESMDELGKIYLARVRESYRRSRVTPIDMIFSTSSFGDFLTKLKYLNTIKAKDQLILSELERSRLDYDQRKQDKVTKQKEVEKLKAKLISQKKVLDSQVADKQVLLVQFQNDEKKFQSLKAEATAELTSLASSQFTGKKDVKKGDIIGVTGNTGFSKGAHLHFGYYNLSEKDHSNYSTGDISWYGDKSLNPESVLSRRNIFFYKDACDDTRNSSVTKDFGNGSASWPMNEVRVTQCYGHTPYFYYYRDNFHHGLDLSGSNDTIVRAVDDGVAYFYRGSTSFGNNVRLFQNNGKMTLYLHLK